MLTFKEALCILAIVIAYGITGRMDYEDALLMEQVASLKAERDSIKSRLNAARSRIDALLDRLPVGTETPSHKDTE